MLIVTGMKGGGVQTWARGTGLVVGKTSLRNDIAAGAPDSRRRQPCEGVREF